ncbi:MAG: YggS family pyridoxal phosphate-dependent enzyme [Alphaproteobacteria bacterium]|nr:MAG: YggS family pyridoxal phosphate-dependent enzyme [Alphaproteobacteria bacterium]
MSIKENLEHIQERIAKAAAPWGRAKEDIHLLAVSKRQSIDSIQTALDCGHRQFAENKVQEATQHWAELKPRHPDLQLHLIGPLQTNKIKDALALFDVIHTVDREKLARKLGAALRAENRSIPCFIQVNIGKEDQKSGIAPNDLPAFLKFCQTECALNIQGLMCIPPADEPAALYFALLQKMAKAHGLSELSMGMSADFERAIPLGATYIRVGTGIFGQRES